MVLLVFLGSGRILTFFGFFLSEIYLIFLFFALTLANKLLEKSCPAAGLSHAFLRPSHPQRQMDHSNIHNKNTSLLVLHVGAF